MPSELTEVGSVKQRPFAVSTGHPPTSNRTPAVDADKFIAKPGVARANAAVSASKPDGDKAYIDENKDFVRCVLLSVKIPGVQPGTYEELGLTW